ncbi:MAG: GNAT family N-acetyltransferase [Clostridia bacterium]
MLNSDFSLSLAGANFFKEKIENEFVYVAKTNGNVIGFVCASKLNNKPWYNKNVAEIISIYVKESYRKKGIGTSLLNKAKDYYNNINIPNILLTMPIKDVSCLEFYKDNDFISCYNTLIYTASYKHI